MKDKERQERSWNKERGVEIFLLINTKCTNYVAGYD